MFDIEGFARYMGGRATCKPLTDSDRLIRGAHFDGAECSIAVFRAEAHNVNGLFPGTVSFSKDFGGTGPTHFFAREVVANAIAAAPLVALGRSLFYARAIGALLRHADGDLIGASQRGRCEPTCFYGRTWIGAAMPVAERRPKGTLRVTLLPISLLEVT